jgi:hypothetical protein
MVQMIALEKKFSKAIFILRVEGESYEGITDESLCYSDGQVCTVVG